MAQWEHRLCGTVHDAGSTPPLHCRFCIGEYLLVGGCEQGWRLVGREPRQQAPRKRGSVSGSRRQRVFARDGYTCVRCGERRPKLLTVDHIHPKSKGGTNAMDNLQTLCEPCNVAKGDTVPPPGMNYPPELAAA